MATASSTGLIGRICIRSIVDEELHHFDFAPQRRHVKGGHANLLCMPTNA